MTNLQTKIKDQIIKPLLFLERKKIFQLFNSTPRKIKSRAKNDITAKLKTISNKGKWVFETITSSNGNHHRQYIIPLMAKKDKSGKIFNLNPNINSAVIVHCDCNNFKFQWEYVLNINDAARVINSNGNPAIVTNPNNIAGFCKHLHKCAEIYMNKII